MRAAKLLLLIVSLLFSVAVSEIGLRILYRPMDLLAPEMAHDPVLGYRIVPGSGGHDAWGFRNVDVPERVDIVTLGDSMTWGVAALSGESWPAWLARQTDRTVYNFGIGGYGPAEYLHLLETKGLSLDPKLIVVGWYLGNDQGDAYQSVRVRPRWIDWRTASMGAFEPGLDDAFEGVRPRTDTLLLRVRSWLRSHSMLFRVVEHSPIGQLANAVGDRTTGLSGDGCTVVTEEPFPTVIQAESRLAGVDLDSGWVDEGLSLNFAFVDRIKALADRQGVPLQVIVIPMKETVVVGRRADAEGECERVVQKIVEDESVIRDRVIAYLEDRGIPYVDPLERMSRAAQHERLYLRSADTHPNGRGYQLIAEELVADLVLDAPNGSGAAPATASR